MDYRGQDLDLRTARWSASSTEPSGWREAAPAPQPSSPPTPAAPAARASGLRASGPIWVDDTLLACANQAFDIALAYRSAEVRLEHLVLAMTRVEAAAAALEGRGVRVVSLRRDSAVTIAGELPTASADASPRRSPELEDVLRLAASRASQAGRAASVDDVALVLGDVGGDLPGADLIVRHFPRRAREFRVVALARAQAAGAERGRRSAPRHERRRARRRRRGAVAGGRSRRGAAHIRAVGGDRARLRRAACRARIPHRPSDGRRVRRSVTARSAPLGHRSGVARPCRRGHRRH